MYVVVGCLAGVHQMFDEIHNRYVVTWPAMIVASSRYGHNEDALA